MARQLNEVDLGYLSRHLKEARERKGWTLQQLSHELWARGFPTAQNKLWRLENRPPRRVDMELVAWLEKILEVRLLPVDVEPSQILLADVLELIDDFIDSRRAGGDPPSPSPNPGLRKIHAKVRDLIEVA